jgi:hypothetical protein
MFDTTQMEIPSTIKNKALTDHPLSKILSSLWKKTAYYALKSIKLSQMVVPNTKQIKQMKKKYKRHKTKFKSKLWVHLFS